jgi:hypothetical protein
VATTRAQLASALSGFSGLDYHVALNWLNAENSVAGNGTNPLGILCGNSAGSGLEIGCAGRFAVYRSATDGVKAAAWLLAHGSHYGAVRTAIAGGTPAEQRASIVNSGWAAGYYHGGTGFSSAGIPGMAGTPAGSDMSADSLTPAAAAAAGSPVGGSSAPTGRTVADLLSGLKPTHLLTAADIEMILGELTVSGPNDPIIASQRTYYTKYIGKPINQVPISGSSVFGGSLETGIGGIPNIFGDWSWVPGLVINVAILATVLILGYRGVRELLG